MKAFERLLSYVRIHTSSSESEAASGQTPSTGRQFNLSRLLESELNSLGFSNVFVDDHAYVYGHLPATQGFEDLPRIGLIAHLDTIPDEDFSGKDVNPQIYENYDGRDIMLGESAGLSSGRVLSTAQFPDLKERIGHTLITTDGLTVLGADDKAGIAEILTACEELLTSGLPHGAISVCFTPDEEIGHGAALLDLERFGADYAFTVDGGASNVINCETFCAASAELKIDGVNVHPGDAKGKMRNACLLGLRFHEMLPQAESPAETEGYEGFYHLMSFTGSVEQATLRYILRDHDAQKLEYKKATMRHAVRSLNERIGAEALHLEIRDQYRNMAEVLASRPEILLKAEQAIRDAGLTPERVPVRGGTDGAQLSFRGLPCPNLGTGGAGFHGPYEHISVESMDRVVRVLVNLLKAE